MHQLFRVFLWGWIISALGTLPFGTLNVAAMQISVAEGWKNAMLFSLGTTLVEVLYVRLSLVGMQWIRKQKKILQWMEWITLFIVIALAIGSFYAAMQPHPAKNVLLQNNINRFLLGIGMSAVNPAQIPFWFGWSTVLFTKKILLPQNDCYNVYMIAIGTGSLASLCVFIFGGHFLMDKLSTSQHILNYIIGGIFSFTAIVQLIKIIRQKGIGTSIDKESNI